MTMVLSVNAQDDMYFASVETSTTNALVNINSAKGNGWDTTTFDADELLGNKAYTALSYSTSVGSIVLWNDNEKKFRIISNNVFDSEYGENGYMVKGSFFHAIVGYYDINDKLIDKRTCSFIIGSNHHEGNSIRYGMKRYEGKHIISYLRNKKGYVRIIASLYNTNSKFDIKVPCMNN